MCDRSALRRRLSRSACAVHALVLFRVTRWWSLWLILLLRSSALETSRFANETYQHRCILLPFYATRFSNRESFSRERTLMKCTRFDFDLQPARQLIYRREVSILKRRRSKAFHGRMRRKRWVPWPCGIGRESNLRLHMVRGPHFNYSVRWLP